MSKDSANEKGGVVESLPPEHRDFLQGVIQGRLMRYDVLLFFYHNPYAILTVSDLSVWVSREERPLAEALQQLAAAGCLVQSVASSAFVLTPDPDKRSRIEGFFRYLEEDPDLARKLRSWLRRREEAE